MPGQPGPSNYWQLLLDLWSEPEAESFLQELPQEPIPKSGPQHKLIQKTGELLGEATSSSADDKNQLRPAQAERCGAQAERYGAISLLARILHRLQQNPCEEDHFEPPQALRTTWYTILHGLCVMVQGLARSKPEAGVQRGGSGPHGQHLSWVQQLQGEAGMCRLGACN